MKAAAIVFHTSFALTLTLGAGLIALI